MWNTFPVVIVAPSPKPKLGAFSTVGMMVRLTLVKGPCNSRALQMSHW